MKFWLKTRLRRWFFPNSSRRHLDDVNRAFAASVPAGAIVLDAGAGTAPYRHMFAHATYETADFEMVDKGYAPSTYVCDLAAIPVADGRFDHILFNQTLEHLPEPSKVLDELWRVLRPGGTLLCTCPLFYEEHEAPYDFYRYTQFAHRHLFAKSRFEIVSLDWLEGYFGTVAYQFEGMFRHLPWGVERIASAPASALLTILLVPLKLAAAVLAAVFYRLDRLVKVTDRGYPKNYAVLAVKPA